MKLEWSDTYSVGNRQLDEQHRKWIEIYNRLDAMLSGDNDEELSSTKVEVLKEMYDYVDYHFRFEEEYMRSINFPEIDKHWRMHKEFRNRVYRICRDNDEGKIVLNTEIMDTMRSWLLDHIVKQDVKIMHFKRSAENK